MNIGLFPFESMCWLSYVLAQETGFRNAIKRYKNVSVLATKPVHQLLCQSKKFLWQALQDKIKHRHLYLFIYLLLKSYTGYNIKRERN